MFTLIGNFLKEIVSLLIALLILGFGIHLYNVLQPMYVSIEEDSAHQSRMVQESVFSPYDGHIVSGSQVHTAMRRYANRESFYIYVDKSGTRFIANPSGLPGTCLNLNFNTEKLLTTPASNCNVTLDQMKQEGGTYYIYPQASFRSTILRDNNDRIAGILFVEL